MLIWGLKEKERFYQYPTLAGATWLFFLVPQAIGALRNPYKFPDGVLGDHGLEIALAMCILCAAAGWWGYNSEHWKKFGKKLSGVNYSPAAVFRMGAALYLVAFYFACRLAEVSGGFVRQFLGGGNYLLTWQGLPVMYVFFSTMMYPALLLCLIAYWHRPNTKKLIAVAAMSVYPLCATVFLGRRSSTAFLGLIALLSVFFVKRWAPSRRVFVAAIIAMGLFTIIAPQYRGNFGRNGIQHVKARSSIAEMLNGSTYSEFDALVVLSALANSTMSFSYGIGIYNRTISQLVPRQVVGERFKNSLMIHLDQPTSEEVYAWRIPCGSDPTGPLNAFQEFWFFGAFLYYVMGMFSRLLWEHAYQFGNIKAQVWYTIWAVIIPQTVYGSISVIPGQLISFWLFLGILFLYGKAPAHWWRRRRATRIIQREGRPNATPERI